MSIVSTVITTDLIRDDNKLSFKAKNEIEYEFNEFVDSYLIGNNEPVGFVGVPTDSQIKPLLNNGYRKKLVAYENVTILLYNEGSNNSFYEKSYHINYYIQTKDIKIIGGGDGGGDRITDPIFDGSGIIQKTGSNDSIIDGSSGGSSGQIGGGSGGSFQDPNTTFK